MTNPLFNLFIYSHSVVQNHAEEICGLYNIPSLCPIRCGRRVLATSQLGSNGLRHYPIHTRPTLHTCSRNIYIIGSIIAHLIHFLFTRMTSSFSNTQRGLRPFRKSILHTCTVSACSPRNQFAAVDRFYFKPFRK